MRLNTLLYPPIKAMLLFQKVIVSQLLSEKWIALFKNGINTLLLDAFYVDDLILRYRYIYAIFKFHQVRLFF